MPAACCVHMQHHIDFEREFVILLKKHSTKVNHPVSACKPIAYRAWLSIPPYNRFCSVVPLPLEALGRWEGVHILMNAQPGLLIGFQI